MEIPGICRCCLTKGVHKIMNCSYTFSNRKEIYSDMLLDCLNLQIIPSPGIVNTICEACIESLRMCVDFREQVVHANTQFAEICSKNEYTGDNTVSEVSLTIKSEPKQESDFSDSDDYILADRVPDITIKKIKIDPEPKIRKLRKRKTSPKGLKKNLNIVIEPYKPTKVKEEKKLDNDIKIESTKKPEANETDTQYSFFTNAKLKKKANLTTIVQYSNALLFKTHTIMGYQCAYCNSWYPDPSDLRKHTETIHIDDRLTFKNLNGIIAEGCVNADITDLKCTICQAKMDNLTQLKTHLSYEHKKIIYIDVIDFIMQFKLQKGDKFDCAMCSSTYETFKMLKQHMNVHYRNFSCSICDATYATSRSLSSHKQTHSIGAYKCDYCEKVFVSKFKKLYHIRQSHLGERNISNCPFCNESFQSYYQRNQHLSKVHNSEPRYKCNICSRDFLLKSLLSAHIKKSHLMEREAQCTECGHRFYSKKGLKAHMIKHTGEKNYSCDVCHKSYGRKYTLREHMRIHNNDRRFKCDVCGAKFVQKCSLKSHLLSNHGISLAASEISTVSESGS